MGAPVSVSAHTQTDLSMPAPASHRPLGLTARSRMDLAAPSLRATTLQVCVFQTARELVKRGGEPRLREGFVTDNGNQILDVLGLRIEQPAELESELNQIVGVVTCGLFARRGADLLLLGTGDGVQTIRRR